MEKQFVVFQVADEQYGVPIDRVESIVKMQPITLVPQAPEFLEGITNLRGMVLPVLSLRKRFGLPPREAGRETRIVVVVGEGHPIGIIVDSVLEVLRLSEDAIEPPPPMVTNERTRFITGIAKVGERLVILLDLVRVLSVEEEVQLADLRDTISA
ncbi:chemotaxis protein CheW [uncultured Thermanaerothrix sp.]|uniref:chemotaxis protein CheW n=1 Tax=uncultured Thermanaerothrix sp. TaxID=1195149 RepID=UPI002612717C|nr:chemotaxis protein CheW [uncultured Thermanaerothrix sp.]